MTPHLVMCHHFHGPQHPYKQGSFDADDLRTVIDAYGSRLIPAREWLHKANTGTLNDGDAALSFDDGLTSQYDIALPVLEDKGLTAFWFVCTAPFVDGSPSFEVHRRFIHKCFVSIDDFYREFEAAATEAFLCAGDASMPVDYLADYPFYSDADKRFRFLRDVVLRERYAGVMEWIMARHRVCASELAYGLWMQPDQISWLHRADHVIGLHSHSHPTRISELPPMRQQLEYALCNQALTTITEENACAVAHPCNSYSSVTLDILRDMGVTVGFRSNAIPGMWSRLEMPREDIANIIGTRR
jgi:peptidoglycan/xylan/chitin deacetylase (PgdA/CDA1 family)